MSDLEEKMAAATMLGDSVEIGTQLLVGNGLLDHVGLDRGGRLWVQRDGIATMILDLSHVSGAAKEPV